MKQRTALLIATAVSVFILALSASVIARLAAETAAPLAPELAPELEATLTAREAEYQRALDQANQQLEEANRRLEQAYATQPAQPGGSVQPQQPAAQQTAFSPDQAAAIALGAAPGAQLQAAPQLVDFEGRLAYEALLDRGTVYVAADSGEVLYNGASTPAGQPPSPVQQAPAPEQSLISADQAAAAALNYLGGGSIERIELEEEHGSLVYEVRFHDDARVYVDAGSGQVVYVRNSDDDRSGKSGDN